MTPSRISSYHYDIGLELANLIEHEADCAGSNSYCYAQDGYMTIDHVGIPLQELGAWVTEAVAIATRRQLEELVDD